MKWPIGATGYIVIVPKLLNECSGLLTM